MEERKKIYRMKKVAAACAAVAIVFGSMTVAYAADIGGIQQKITAWFHGEQTQMDITDNGNGSYTYTFTDKNGKEQSQTGGGVEIDDNGNERRLSAEDLLDSVSNCVQADEDGTIWLYFYDKKVNVTDLFDEDGICKIALEHEGEIYYFKIQESPESAITGSYGYERSPEAPQDVENYPLVK